MEMMGKIRRMYFRDKLSLHEIPASPDTASAPFAEWSSVFGDIKMTTSLPDQLTHHCHIVETGNETYHCNTAVWRSRHRSNYGSGNVRPARISRTTNRFDFWKGQLRYAMLDLKRG